MNERDVGNVYVMTSPMLYEAIVNAFQVHDFFGIERSHLHFFNQSVLPCFKLDGTLATTGDETDSSGGSASVSVSPGGHGDLFHALAASGLLSHMEEHNVEYVFSFNVDNPLAVAPDPTYLGFQGLRKCPQLR